MIFLLFFFFFLNKEYKFFATRTVKLILLFCLYLICNSVISKDFSMSAYRNFGFIRFGIVFCAFNYFFYHKIFFNKILIIWSLTLFLLVMAAGLGGVFGGIVGYGELYGEENS